MRNSRRVFLTAFPGLVLVLDTMCAFASGREGEAFVEPVRWIVAIVLVTFATSRWSIREAGNLTMRERDIRV